MEQFEEISVDDPWQNGEAQRQDAEALEVPAHISEIIQEVLLMMTERVSIL